MRELRIDKAACTLCGACFAACPFGALSECDGTVVIGDSCNLCGACVPECPAGALDIPGPAVEVVDVSGWSGIWVFAEPDGEGVAGVARELLGAARDMAAATGETVSAVVLGAGIGDLAGDLIAHGADRVYVADHPLLEAFVDETYTSVLASLIREHRPSVVLLGATSMGRALAPRVAARLGTGLTADCTGLELGDDGLLQQTRPAFGGSVMATIVCRSARPQMATVRPRVMGAIRPSDDRQGDVVEVDLPDEAAHARSSVLERVDELGDDLKIEDADIIVAGGRGVGGPEGFEAIRDLASQLGAAVGASRPVVDSGWLPYAHQIGQTGKTVAPRIYIACGISGAVQHLAGMRSSDVIIAVNKNPDAPIFKVATYGLVGDMFEIIPALGRALAP